ncbi:MAG: hypothetical protein CMH58_03425 [Myxococcales bacterium]|nr:hypothetical protein [Myxococcales bacterium]
MNRGPALFLLALLARLLFLGDARWTSEESYFFAWVHDVASGLKWDGLGTPVSGSSAWHPGSWFFLVLVPFAWLSNSPWAIAIGVAVIDSVAVLLAWLGLRGLMGKERQQAAWYGALFLALSPWALLYADRPWNSNLVSLPASLIVFGLGAWWQGTSRRWPLVVVLAGAATFPSFHLSAPLYWLPVIFILWFGRARGFPGLLLGIVVAFSLQAPYVINELKTDFRNSRHLLSGENNHAHRSLGNSLLALSWPIRMTTSEIGYHAQQGYWHDYDASAPILRPSSQQGVLFWQTHRNLGILAVIVSSLLAIFSWFFWLRHIRWRQLNEDPFSLFLLLGTLTGWVLIVAASRKAYPHYMQPLLPFYLGVIGLGVARYMKFPKKGAPIILWAVLLLGLAPTSMYYAERDRPFGLAANLATLDAVEQLGNQVDVRFCGRLKYRSRVQLNQIARITHPNLLFTEGHPRMLLHLERENLEGILYRKALWQHYAHGQWMVLVDNPLPRTLRLLSCT